MKNNYVLGNTSEEIQRLKIQSSLFEPIAKESLLKAGIRNGMVCADIGCGSGDVTRMIGKIVGKKGQVLGVDINNDYIKYCKDHTKQSNISFVCDDITKSDDIKNETFDMVYSRFMFVHLTDKVKALKSMIRITKKGGTIIIQELDHAPDSWLSYPKRQSVDKLRKMYVKLVKKARGDPLAGRKLYKMFVDQHLHTTVECYSPCLVMGREPYNTLGWRIAQSLKPQIQSLDLMRDKEYNELFKELKEMSMDPHSFVLYSRLFSVIGRRK
ncbi:MAG: methyltransferase domain-containing protein [Thaumarchaeota archaeon]|nr:methyltransferase domain-containing protein [Nitrososphaerota archaeon]